MEYRILSLLERQLLSLGLLEWELLLNPRKKASKWRNSYLSQAIEGVRGLYFSTVKEEIAAIKRA